MPTIDEPGPSSGSSAVASDLNEYALTWIVVATSSQGAFKNAPSPRHDAGAKPIECSTPSRPGSSPRCGDTRSTRLSSCDWSETSSSTTGAPSGSRCAIRSTSRIRPNPVSTTCAPCSCAIFAAWKASEASVITPVTSSRLPSRSPMAGPYEAGGVVAG